MLQLRAASSQNITQLRLCFPVVFGVWHDDSWLHRKSIGATGTHLPKCWNHQPWGIKWGVHTDICSSPFHPRRSRVIWCGGRGTKICCTQIFQPLVSGCLSISFVVGGKMGKQFTGTSPKSVWKLAHRNTEQMERNPMDWVCKVQQLLEIRNLFLS